MPGKLLIERGRSCMQKASVTCFDGWIVYYYPINMYFVNTISGDDVILQSFIIGRVRLVHNRVLWRPPRGLRVIAFGWQHRLAVSRS